ncbi:MAG: type II toxin-antitoxin system VapC family toxin [Gammaproteobacteria bacterium]|nr:type II toxin-antitoxin system VapC family toxin [Gammaproteobacteria bacterium]
MYLVDVNILVYAHREDVDNHDKFCYWLESVINANSDYGYSELVLSGFLRVVTHPKVFETPTPLEEAIKFVRQIKSQPNSVKIIPKERHWAIFEDLIRMTGAKGNFIPDAYHAALAIESGCQWVTTDKGFKKFKGLKTKNPLSP